MTEEPRNTGVPGIALGLVSCLIPIACVGVLLVGAFSFNWFDFMAGPSTSQHRNFAMIYVAGVAIGIGGCFRRSWITGVIGILLNSWALVDAIYRMSHPVHW